MAKDRTAAAPQSKDNRYRPVTRLFGLGADVLIPAESQP
jgi:hypothetical protein